MYWKPLRYLHSLSLIVLFVLPGKAQDITKPFTLMDCIEQALKENIQLKQQLNNQEIARYDREQSQWDLGPSISGGASSGVNFGRGTDQNNNIQSGTSYSVGYGISASLTLIGGLKKINTIAARKYIELAYRETTQKQINALYLQIVDLYTRILYQKELIKVAKEKLELSKLEAERITATIESGLLEEVAQHEINATVSSNQLELDQRTNNHNLLLLDLAQLIEYPDIEHFDIDTFEFGTIQPSTLNYTPEMVYQWACMNLPRVKAKEFELAYSKKVLAIYKGNLAPSLDMNGGYRSSFYSTDTLVNGSQTPFGNQFSNYLNPSLGVSLNVPIFNGRASSYQLKKQRLTIENANYNLEYEKKVLLKEIELTLKQLQAYETEYKSASDNLVYVEKSFETNREKYQLGLLNATDFVFAQNQLSQAKVSVVNAKYNWIVQEKTLRLLMGESEGNTLWNTGTY